MLTVTVELQFMEMFLRIKIQVEKGILMKVLGAYIAVHRLVCENKNIVKMGILFKLLDALNKMIVPITVFHIYILCVCTK